MDNETIKRAKEIIELQAERTSLKTMADYVKEYIIAYCDEDPDFVGRVNDPEKCFMGCIGYIKKKALDWLKEQENLELTNYAQGVGGDVPNDTCYQWAIEYYYSKPEPKPEPKKIDTAGSSKTKDGKKGKGATAKEAAKDEPKNLQMSLMDNIKPENNNNAEPISLFDSTELAESTGVADPDSQFDGEEDETTEGASSDFTFEGMDVEFLTEEEEAELPFYKEAV